MVNWLKKKKEKNLETTEATVKIETSHVYTLYCYERGRNNNCVKIWYTYSEEQSLEKVFEDFIDWYQLKLHQPVFKIVGDNFVTMIHRDNIASINMDYKIKRK